MDALMKFRFGTVLVLLFLAGCSIDIGGGSQLTGQRCFQESDCADGLTCFERTCRPLVGGGGGGGDRDAGGNNANNQNNDNNETDGGGPINNTIVPIDAGPGGCMPGERFCAGDATVQLCIEQEGGTVYVQRDCVGGEVCVNGRCAPSNNGMCVDADGDGYGMGCDAGPDCDDLNPDRNPGLRERCNTPFDDNCNGERNEGCDPDGDCCPGGCPGETFCSAQCQCTDYDPDICEFQHQPCFNEGQFENGFFCAFLGGEEARCYGICDVNSPNPDATCPEPGSVCAFGAGGGGNEGICLAGCDVGPNGQRAGCGEDDMGCLALQPSDSTASGVCAPINDDNGLNDRCSPDEFFDCDEGLVCVDGGGGGFGGRCRESCRPFAYDGNATDCTSGHCVAFSPGFGICSNDNNRDEGEACNPPLTACGEDAVSCYPNGMGQGNSCLRVCRIDEGNADCPAGSCNQFSMDQPDLGICF